MPKELGNSELLCPGLSMQSSSAHGVHAEHTNSSRSFAALTTKQEKHNLLSISVKSLEIAEK